MKRSYISIIIFMIFIIIYFLFYAFYGFNDADDGFTIALSWRVFNGAIPYKDFILVRPPLSPLFHTLTLYLVPDNYQIIFERFLFYFLLALSSLFGSLSIDKAFKLKEFQISPYLLATVGFVLSVRNFPPMPWHTVDGIFFASLGIFILVRFTTSYSIIFGMLFLFFSALCKQPFYLMPLAGIAYTIITHKDWRKSVVSILSLLGFISAFIFIIFKLKALSSFINLTSGSTKIRDFLYAGVIKYFSIKSVFLIVPAVIWVVAQKLSKNKYFSRITVLVPYFFISLLLFYPLPRFIYTVLYKGIPYNIANSAYFIDSTATLLFFTAIFLFIANFAVEKKWISLWFLTLLSWCASISWGYQTPVLFSIPLLFGFFIASYQYFKINNLTTLAIYTLLIGTITYYVAYQKPLGNPVRHDLNYEISDIFPKLKFIKVGKDIHDKYHELRSLTNKYGNNFKTLPGMPLSNYLTNTTSPIPIDWVFNAETNNNDDDILNILSQKRPVVFIEKEPQMISVTNLKGKFDSPLTYFIKSNWIKVDSTNYFDIYKIK